MEFESGFQMAALQLRNDNFYNPFLNDAETPGKIHRLFRPYLRQGSTDIPAPPPHQAT